jgi:ring-1,2-phenylacetyl-CoA epoxidase subunit PaaA
MSNGTIEQQEMAQDALNRWWWPSLMMFGPHDSDSAHTSNAMKWKIKRESNDELRQIFVDRTVKQANLIGLSIPDSNLKWNPKLKHYEFGEINWDEFWEVVNGNGFCNRERIRNHINAHVEGEWVREAVIAYSNKNKS